jgi:hypothetical protein
MLNPGANLTLVVLLGEYAAYFASSGAASSLLRAVTYTVNALIEPTLSLQASMTLKELCDANRSLLAPHIGSFAELHRNVEVLGAEEKSKVLESIASVISALPPKDAIAPIQAVVQPLLESLARSLNTQMVRNVPITNFKLACFLNSPFLLLIS